ncbi:lipopolysaccharide transport periplasmic protein LptA [Betaproteobacteria bacterium PRO4]|uniref:lipopolysaccharide transport periplasmic protein LptA n=2 Tax=Nitrosomonas sp. TaxID=42353 RepID=UPI00256BE65C|nr:lipopolysaccharide transport periplasmic protein LptA [Nitrosomonas sp.]MDL1866696.1 lipopolysaccharide transport periplasmic protein LptA [Betaproteobacteria bacterium PRO4]
MPCSCTKTGFPAFVFYPGRLAQALGVLSGLCLMLFSAMVSAERADRDKPIHLEADRATVEDYKRKSEFRTSVFTGNVIMTQGTLTLKADKVIMKEDTTGYRHATAHGNLVSYREKRDGVDEYVEAWAKRAEYDDKTEKIELFGSARLKRGTDEVEGDYISYDIASDFFQVFGQPQPENDKHSDHRVRAVIQPKAKQPAPETGK